MSYCSLTISRSTAAWAYPLALFVLSAVCNTVPFASVGLSLCLVVALCVTTCVFACAKPPPQGGTVAVDWVQNVTATSTIGGVGGGGGGGGGDDESRLVASVAAAPSRSPRLAYLDNLKSTLTAIVVVHHVMGAFAGGGSVGLSVGNFRNPLQPVLGVLQLLNQVRGLPAVCSRRGGRGGGRGSSQMRY